MAIPSLLSGKARLQKAGQTRTATTLQWHGRGVQTHACQEAQRGQQRCLEVPLCCIIAIMPREHAAAAAVLCCLHARRASSMDERHNDGPGDLLCQRLHW